MVKRRRLFLCLTWAAALALGMGALLSTARESGLERRTLSPRPTGGSVEEWEAFLVDHLPGRQLFVTAERYLTVLTGRGMTLAAWPTLDGGAVESPLTFRQEALEKRLTRLTMLCRGHEAVLLPVPQAGTYAALPPWQRALYDDEPFFASLAGRTDATLADVRAAWMGQTVFYRTDHHWNQTGAYLAYQAAAAALGIAPRPLSDYRLLEMGSLAGSTRAQTALAGMAPDPLTVYEPPCRVRLTVPGEETRDSLFFEEYRDTEDAYRVFTGPNRGETWIENLDADTDETLIVFKDSFANSLVGFLTPHFRRIVMVDLRYELQGAGKVLTDWPQAKCLLVYSLDSLQNDTSLLRFAP